MITLKNCPWCGGVGILQVTPVYWYKGHYIYEVHCTKCKSVAPDGRYDDLYYTSEAAQTNAISAWNTRCLIETPTDKCSCYMIEYGRAVCYGTKERDLCSCQGNRKRCDFYEPDM